MEQGENHYHQVMDLLEFLKELSPKDAEDYHRCIVLLHQESNLVPELKAS
jgi:hypothetical protein